MVFTFGPGQELGRDPARGAIDPPAGIPKEDCKAPERDKLKGPFRESIIPRAVLPAARAIGLGALTGHHPDLDGVRLPGGESGFFVHKTLEMITAIQ
jgi:hypothetical protein